MDFKKFGRYTILEKIASGGMAEILLAADLGTAGVSRFVSIKRTLVQFSEKEDFKDMFRNEGKIACTLKHRNITPIYEFGIENNKLFMAMEYVAGKNLRQILKKMKHTKKSISIPHAVHVIKEAASGLNYAHNVIDPSTGERLHLIHRDVSPQNILISFDGEIKLIDFGIAKLANTDLTQAGHLKGKFGYMSPEQVQGNELNHRTDIFSLGIILWELLANKRLFSYKNEMVTLKKIKACHIPDLNEINAQVPKVLVNIVNKALSKNQNLRYGSMAQMEKDLSIFLNTEYPYFSQYDLSSFMKEIHEREILKERGQLNYYSKQLVAHIKKLNQSDHFNNKHEQTTKNRFFGISDIDDEVRDVVPTVTEIDLEKSIEKKLQTAKLENTGSYSQSQHRIEKTKSKSQINKVKNRPQLDDEDRRLDDEDRRLDDVDEHSSLEIISSTKDQPKQLSQASFTSKSSTQRNTATVHKENIKRKSILPMIGVVSSLFISVGLIVGGLTLLVNFKEFATSDILNQVFNLKKKDRIKTTTPFIPPSNKQVPKREKRELANLTGGIFIETKPSGASIILNGKLQNIITPATFQIPLNSSVLLIIQKNGYKKKRLSFQSGESFSSYLEVELSKKPSTQYKNIKILK